MTRLYDEIQCSSCGRWVTVAGVQQSTLFLCWLCDLARGTEATCPTCGGPMQDVRPGKAQCPKCEGGDAIVGSDELMRRVRADSDHVTQRDSATGDGDGVGNQADRIVDLEHALEFCQGWLKHYERELKGCRGLLYLAIKQLGGELTVPHVDAVSLPDEAMIIRDDDPALPGSRYRIREA